MSFIWHEQLAAEKKQEFPRKRKAAFSLLSKVAGFMVVLRLLPMVIDLVTPEPEKVSPTPPTIGLPTPTAPPSV